MKNLILILSISFFSIFKVEKCKSKFQYLEYVNFDYLKNKIIYIRGNFVYISGTDIGNYTYRVNYESKNVYYFSENKVFEIINDSILENKINVSIKSFIQTRASYCHADENLIKLNIGKKFICEKNLECKMKRNQKGVLYFSNDSTFCVKKIY
jgi:hypothetical protein